MIFSHSQDQLDLRDGAREYLRGRCSRESLRELLESENSSLNIWSELVEMGLPGFLASEDLGGLAMDKNAFTLIAEEAGYVALPEPLIEVAGISMPVLTAIDSASSRALLQRVCAGEQRVLVSHALSASVNQLQPKDQVLWFADDEVHCLGAENLTAELGDSIDPLRRVHRLQAKGSADTVFASGDTARKLFDLAARHGAVFIAAELLGLANAMIEMATEYAKERKQFGSPIGSYQAVKHHLANAFTAMEFARPVVYQAAAVLQDDSRHDNSKALDLKIAHAKIVAIDAASKAAETAIQVHGGMGYTFEVDLHLWMKRVWALSGLWGDRNHHMKIIEAALFEQSVATGPGNTFR